MKEITFNGYNDYPLNLCIWEDVENPIGVVQIIHGMAEHAKRYNRFAEFLNKNGYIAVADDHRGHGKTNGTNDGRVPEGDCFRDTVNDEILITDYIKEKYALPVFIFGHSYGSFITQSYIQKASELVKAVIISGSAKQDTVASVMGRHLANIQLKLYGKDKSAVLIDKLAFGTFDKPFRNEKRKNAWITSDKEEWQKYADDEMCGQVMSVGFFQSFFKGLKSLYTEEGLSCIRKDLPILIVSGDKDPVGGNSKLVKNLYEMYAECALNDISLKLYKGGRHEILNETNRDEVMEDLLEFINSKNN